MGCKNIYILTKRSGLPIFQVFTDGIGRNIVGCFFQLFLSFSESSSWKPTFPHKFLALLFFSGRKTITGSFVGSIKETEEMLEFCKEKDLTSTIEVVKMDYINTAFERLEKNDVRYRFVVDVAGSKLEQ